MTDEPLSTTITETSTVSGAGMVNPPAEPAQEPEAKQSSVGDTLRAELARTREAEKAAKQAEAPKEQPKDEAKPADEKPAAEPKESGQKPAPDAEQKDAAADPEQGDKSSEGKKPEPGQRNKYDSPPEKVAPHARAKWANVPSELKAEFHRIVEAQDNDTRQYQEDRQFRESLRQYDDLAKRAGTTIDKALERYVDIDKRLTSGDPNTRARTVLEVMQAGNVDPVQFARSILANEGQFKQQPQQPQRDPMLAQMAQQVQQLTQKLEQQEMEKRTAPLQQTLSEFTADKPDFDDLQQDIADILNSGIIQKRFPGLSPDQLLAEAYRRAGGAHLNSQSGTQAAPQDPIVQTQEPPRPVNPDAGRKSISGAPTGGKTPLEASKAKSIRDLLAEEARKKRA